MLVLTVQNHEEVAVVLLEEKDRAAKTDEGQEVANVIVVDHEVEVGKEEDDLVVEVVIEGGLGEVGQENVEGLEAEVEIGGVLAQKENENRVVVVVHHRVFQVSEVYVGLFCQINVSINDG